MADYLMERCANGNHALCPEKSKFHTCICKCHESLWILHPYNFEDTGEEDEPDKAEE